jgi:FO synthase subunit 2
MGKIPAQRKSDYQIIKTFLSDNLFDEEMLDKSNPEDFGSYKELIKLDHFRFKKS